MCTLKQSPIPTEVTEASFEVGKALASVCHENLQKQEILLLLHSTLGGALAVED